MSSSASQGHGASAPREHSTPPNFPTYYRSRGSHAPRLLDLFSGIGGFSFAFEQEGFKTAAFSEIAPFPSNVLTHHWPSETVPNLGDVTKIRGEDLGRVDVITGGFPCQDLSVAGKRRGLESDRSGLFFEIVRLARETRAPWLVLENVPGLLSSNKGRDFGIVLDSLGELGYGLSWRVLDAQYFGVPQRRRRVFIVGHLGGPCPPEILFEREGVRRDIEEGTEAREEVAGTLGGGSGARGWADDTDRMTFVPAALAGGLTSRYGKGVNSSVDDGAIIPFNRLEDDFGDESETTSPSLTEGRGEGRVAVLAPQAHPPAIASPMAVRRLTPKECERLQGFPDDFTNIPGASDAARYRALGNAVAVPCVQWIARRLKKAMQ